MKKYLFGLGLLLSVNGVFADGSGLDQSMKNMLASAKEKQMASALKSPQAFQGRGPLLLRDAIYLYNQPVYAGNAQALIGIGCDIFQLVMDVENGYTDLAIFEGINSGGYDVLYPDRIYANAAMFAYALYSGHTDKGFEFYDNRLYGAPGVDPNRIVGRGTAFGYCFSTNPGAAVFACDEVNCSSSSEVNP